jgi:hypothetical protein
MSTKTPVKKTVAKKTPAVRKVAAKKAVAKNVSAKKTVAKKVVAKKMARRQGCPVCGGKAVCAPQESFWVNNGPVVDSLAGLLEALNSMTNDQYAYHTKRDGNDFARWVRSSLACDQCAVRLEKAKSKTGAVRAISVVCR